ncbi:heterokaryon incompatibility het-6 [Fusarium pseudoanthophilum]|uniref:Heterokaryon incompatibility het-6 n=1 Tax=Fusarium pseudoanthophilum TaxID=48495 RepID=A0A8H5P720_9HYPO|nr:heterokaryon incompatibility het-6 [Fusarium pseudoanthophilum]
MMRDIYSRATAVFAWLGPGFPDSDLAMEALQHNEPESLSNAEPAPTQTRLALNRLFNNPYFTRLWVVQEFILAKDLWILCGAQMCTWTQFRTTFLWKSQTQLVRDLIQAKARDPAPFDRRRRSTPPLGFLEAISRFSFRACSEVRDKVYGLLGIIPQCDVHLVNFRVDYDISVERLFYLTANWQRAVNSWLWTGPQEYDHYLYDKLGMLLQVNSQIVNAQKLMDQMVAYIAYQGIPEPKPTPSAPDPKWSIEYFEKQAYKLLALAGIDVDGAISLDEAFECLMQDPKISGGLDDPAGWRAYESEIKAALRLINGESWGDVGPILQKEKPAVNIACPLSGYKIQQNRAIAALSPFGWLIRTGESFQQRMCRLNKGIGVPER